MKECLVPFLACYIVPYGSPFLDRFNDLISWTEQAGIFQYWERSMNENPRILSQFHNVGNDEEANGHLPLTIDNMVLFFYFWLGGLILSLCVFLWEWLGKRVRRN